MRKTSNSVLSQYRGALMGISIILIIVFHFTDDCHKKIKKNSDSLLHRSRTLLYFTGCLCG